jgi:hypothetical protein
LIEGVPKIGICLRGHLPILGTPTLTPRALSYTFETDLLEHAQQCLTKLKLRNPVLIRHLIGIKFLCSNNNNNVSTLSRAFSKYPSAQWGTYFGNTLPTPRALSYTFETDLLEHAKQGCLTKLTLQPYFNKAPYILG